MNIFFFIVRKIHTVALTMTNPINIMRSALNVTNDNTDFTTTTKMPLKISIEFGTIFVQLNNKIIYLRSFTLCANTRSDLSKILDIISCYKSNVNAWKAVLRAKKAFKHVYCRHHRTMMAIFIPWLRFFFHLYPSLHVLVSPFFPFYFA